jgi:hypothetical protein
VAELIANVLAASDGTITTLAAPIASTGATSITTAAAAPSALHGGEFRVRIGNELLLVTGGQNTTTWTVQRGAEGTTAATHASGAKVRHIFTAGAVEQLLSAQSGSDASTATKGVARLSVAPSTPTAPIAVGTNDPRITVAYIWDEDAETYVPLGGIPAVAGQLRSFLGPIDPVTVGFDQDGDTWDSTVAA